MAALWSILEVCLRRKSSSRNVLHYTNLCVTVTMNHLFSLWAPVLFSLFSYDSRIISPDLYWHIYTLNFFCYYYLSLLLFVFIFLSSNLLPISCRRCLPSCQYGGGTVDRTHWRAPPMWLRWGWGRDTRGPPPCWGPRAGEKPLWASQGLCPGRRGSRANSQHWTGLCKLY